MHWVGARESRADFACVSRFSPENYTNLTTESLTRLRSFRYSGSSIVAGAAIEGILERAMRSFYYCFAFTYRFSFTGSGPAKRARMI